LLNTDDRPLIEFLAPRLTRVTDAGDKDWFTGEALASFYDTLATRQSDNPGPFVSAAEEVRAARRAGTALFRYALAATRHDDITATRLQAEIRTLVPTVIRAAEAADRTPSITDTRQELAGLCAEQEKALRRLGDMQQRLRELTNEEDNSQ
jgi:hypothetical protein